MKESLSYITINMGQRLSVKAREYMLTYLHKALKNEMESSEGEVKFEWNYDYDKNTYWLVVFL